MGHYELRGRERVWVEDTPPAPPPPPTSGSSGTSWSEPSTYNTNLGSKFFAIFLPILAFIIGQIIQYVVYDKNGTVLLFDLIFPRVPKAVLIVSTILGIVSIVHISVRSWKLADEDEIVFSWIYNGTASICFAVCPCISGYIGIILTSAISYCLNNYEEERLPYFFTLTACVLGCAITFSQNYNSDKVIILTKLIILTENFDFNVTAFLIITSIINILVAIILSIASAKLSNAKELFAILLPFCILTIIVPTICAFLLLAYAITIIIIVNKTNSAMIISGIFYSAIIVITIVLGIIGVATAANSNVIEGYNIEKISSFSDISSMANQEVIAIDISGIENKTGKIDTDLDCNVLIIVGKRDDFYSLTINTNATKVIFKNLNISYGCARFTNEIVNVKLIGANSIVGKNGNSGSGWGGSGKNGESAIYAKRITFSGNGSIVLTGGNGGSGSTGLYGSDAGLFGNGGNGERGGNGGNSGYVISCSVANVEDFSGLITLINGKAGSGGSGGRGGSGGLFGSNGSNGSSGYSGSISGYCNGVVDIPNEYIIKK